MAIKEVMKIEDLSKYLSLSEGMIRNLVKKNEIPYMKFSNKILFQKRMIDQWLTAERIINSPIYNFGNQSKNDK